MGLQSILQITLPQVPYDHDHNHLAKLALHCQTNQAGISVLMPEFNMDASVTVWHSNELTADANSKTFGRLRRAGILL